MQQPVKKVEICTGYCIRCVRIVSLFGFNIKIERRKTKQYVQLNIIMLLIKYQDI